MVEVQDVGCMVIYVGQHTIPFSYDSMQFFKFIDKILKKTKTGRNLEIKSSNFPQLSPNLHVHVVRPLYFIWKDHSDLEYFNARVYVTGQN